MKREMCDLSRLDAFARGELSEQAESQLAEHLNACESCGAELEQRVAERSVWDEVSDLLGGPGSPYRDPDRYARSRNARWTQVDQVVGMLLPTDDPQMLGRIGGYEISGVVGAGGMGVVLKAHDRSLDRIVAIKVMAPHLAASGSARQRFSREAKAAAAVLHPNVIAIHGVFNDGPLPYLVMPYVRGASLQRRLDEQGPLPLADVLRIGNQIAAGLAAAHGQGLVHRDIKPANILLDDGVERVAITDFGLARAVDDASMTKTGAIAGTPQYMSPEQARGESVDHRSDLFSLGSLLYTLCTGRPPFRAESVYGILRRITDDDPPPIREINPDIPEWLCKIIRKLMAKDAANRFDLAEAVASLLEDCLAHVHAPTQKSLPPFASRYSWLERLIPIMSDKRILSIISLGLLIAAALMPWPIASMGRFEPAIIFAAISALLGLLLAILSRGEYFSRLVLWTYGSIAGLLLLGLLVLVPLYAMQARNQEGAARDAAGAAMEAERQAMATLQLNAEKGGADQGGEVGKSEGKVIELRGKREDVNDVRETIEKR